MATLCPKSSARRVLQVTIASANVNVTPRRASALFRPFVRVSDALGHRCRNAKLKLTLIGQLMRLRKKRIKLADRPKINDYFAISLPTATETVVRPGPNTSITVGPSLPPLVLLTRSGRTGLDALSDCLNTGKFHLLITRGNRRTVTLTRTRPPGLVLISLRLPKASNLEIVRRLHRVPDLTTIPVLTLNPRPISYSHYLTIKTASYLPRPIQLGSLTRAVRALLNQKKQPR